MSAWDDERWQQEEARQGRSESARRAHAEQGLHSGNGKAMRLEGLTGEGLVKLLERDDGDSVSAGLGVPGHLELIVGSPFAGKTALALWRALARAAGVAPWAGAPQLEAGGVLLLAPDESAAQLVRRMRSLMIFHPARERATLEELLRSGAIEVLAPDRDADDAMLELCSFTDRGLAALLRRLETDKGLIEVYADAWADMLPPKVSENDNERASAIGRALEHMAVDHGVGITVLAHAIRDRMSGGEHAPRPRDLARGASALAAKARIVTGIYPVSGLHHARTLWTETNLSRPPRKLTLSVAGQRCEPGEILHWQIADLGESYPVDDYLQVGDAISQSELARRLYDLEDMDGKKAEPTGPQREHAKAVAETWEDLGLVDVGRSRPGRPTKIRRVS